MRGLIVAALPFLAALAVAQSQVFGWREDAQKADTAESMRLGAFTPEGDFVVVGTFTNGTHLDLVARKLDPFGKEIWRATYDLGGGLNDSVADLALDAKGDLYIACSNPSNGTSLMYVLKLAGADGKKVYQSALASQITSTGFALDVNPTTGEVVQAGGAGSNSREQMIVVKWNPDGTQAWESLWQNEKGDTQGFDVAFAPNGEITAVGFGQREGRGQDAAIVRYTASGQEKWAYVYAGAEGFGRDAASRVVHAPNGDAIVAGGAYVEGSATYLFVQRRAASNGAEEWTYVLSEPRGVTTETIGMAWVGDGVHVGVSYNLIREVVLGAVKVNETGGEVWRANFGGGADYRQVGGGFAVDPYGNSYVTGGSADPQQVQKYLTGRVRNNGEVRWFVRDGGGLAVNVPGAVVIEPASGHVLVVGHREAGRSNDVHLLCYFQAPEAADDSFSVVQGETLTRTVENGVKENDVFAKFAQVFILEEPTVGTLDLKEDGSFTFTAPADFEGEVRFAYELVRDGLTPGQAVVTIRVRKKE